MRCVYGVDPTQPNKLDYITYFSERIGNVWIGWCKGDKKHSEHFIKVTENVRSVVIRRSQNSFRTPQKDLSSRVFERQKLLRCPKGKVYMALQKVMTKKQPFDNLDIYQCKGNLKGKGHRPHYVKLVHGETDFTVNGKKIKVLIVTIESKNQKS